MLTSHTMPALLLALALALSSLTGTSAAVLSSAFISQLEAIRAKWGVPGAVVALAASPGYTNASWAQEVYGLGQGTAAGDNVTEETMWGIASNSKLFNAISVGLLITNRTTLPVSGSGSGSTSNGTGVVQFDSKVQAVLPSWNPTDEYVAGHAQILDVMSMRSGLPSHDLAHEVIPASQVLDLLPYLRTSSELRQSWQYSNLNYFTLAETVRVLSGGMPYVDFVQRAILNPLNMTSATYNSTAAAGTGRRAGAFLSHGQDWGACRTYAPGSGAVPAGCLGTRADFGWWTKGNGVDEAGPGSMVLNGRDMTKWIRELLDPTHLPASLVAAVAQPQTVIPFSPPYPDSSTWIYGLAQLSYQYRGVGVVEHTGGLPGQQSLLLRLPDRGVGVMIAANDEAAGFFFVRTAGYMILDELLGVPLAQRRNWEELLMPTPYIFPEPTPTAPVDSTPGNSTSSTTTSTASTSTSAPSPSTLGSYYDRGYGSLNFTSLSSSSSNSSNSSTITSAIVSALSALPQPIRTDNYTHLAFLPSKAFVNALLFTHYDGPLWNWTALLMLDTPAGTFPAGLPGQGSAIVTDQGVGMFGNYWVAGPSVPVRHADKTSTKADAEVWYDKV